VSRIVRDLDWETKALLKPLLQRRYLFRVEPKAADGNFALRLGGVE